MSAEEKTAIASGSDTELQPVAGREGMTDETIVANLIASNENEVKLGGIVAGKTTNPEIKKMAQMLVKDHGATLKKLEALRGKSGIQPVEDVGARALKDEGRQKLTSIEGMSGKDLDMAFLDTAVEGHQKTLTKIDEGFLPAAKSEDLKALLADVRPVVQKHLDHARMLRDKMKK
jgi:putative membrane protein